MLLALIFVLITNAISNAQQIEFWLTDPDAKILFQQQPFISPNSNNQINDVIININENKTYQTIDGFGYTLTGGSAMHLHNLDNITRAQILQELFNTDKNNIGVCYALICT
ncbi:unnamed protein product [Rotaria sp. Silwood2]|nr:unnamed protein product [Rotaria sp. Silwood2]CAF3937231.1 unnamed protein product [Rotaria sp. Silwood2]